MIVAMVLIVVGLVLSAFFSGSETGFFRVSRVRLALDAREGSLIAKAQLWFINYPSMFVAATLIGNNLANNVVSLGIVMTTQHVMGTAHAAAEMMAAIVAAPVVFIYGELLPKMMFFSAPNHLLRRTGAVFLFFAVLFAPVSILLGLLSWLLQWMAGESHSKIRERLARQEVRGILVEGREAGILANAQVQLAQAVFNIADKPVARITIPLERAAAVRDSDSVDVVVRTATRQQVSDLVVLRGNSRNVLGYVRVSDVLTSSRDWREATRALIAVRHDDTHLAALIKMRKSDAALAEVVDTAGRTVGILSIAALIDPLQVDR